jgi:protein-disulfide isomerase
VARADQLTARRNRRLRQLALVAGAAVVAVVVAIAVSSSGGGGKPKASDVSANRATIAAVTQELSGIPQSGTRLGSASAPVKLTYYGDLQCPVCRDFTLGSLRELIAKDVRAGKLQVDYRSLQTATPDASVFKIQQVAALAAGRQNRAWHFIELFYNEQGQEGTPYVTEAYLNGLARQTPGLDLARWQRDRSAPALASQVSADAASADAAGASATPTLLIQGPKGKAQPITGAPPYSQIQRAIDSVS